MIPAAFDYVRAGSAEEAVALLGEHGDDAKLLAGGHSLLPLMKLRLAAPSVVVDVGRVRDLSYVRDNSRAERWTSQWRVSAPIATSAPLSRT